MYTYREEVKEEGGLPGMPDGRAGGFGPHGKSRVQINSQIRGTDQGILIKTGVQINYGRSESGHNSNGKQ